MGINGFSKPSLQIIYGDIFAENFGYLIFDNIVISVQCMNRVYNSIFLRTGPTMLDIDFGSILNGWEI